VRERWGSFTEAEVLRLAAMVEAPFARTAPTAGRIGRLGTLAQGDTRYGRRPGIWADSKSPLGKAARQRMGWAVDEFNSTSGEDPSLLTMAYESHCKSNA
jgi:hypothetical protein